MARQHDLFLQRFKLQARFGQAAFALAQLKRGVQPGGHAVLHQFQGFGALGQGALGQPGLFIQTQPVEISSGHLAGQKQTRGLPVRLHRTGRAQRCIQRSLVPAEKIKLPAAGELDRAVGDHRTGQRRGHQTGFGVALAGDVQLPTDLRQISRAGDIHRRLRTGQTRLRHLQAGVVGQRLGDQTAQLVIPKGAPPLGIHGGRQHGWRIGRCKPQRPGGTHGSHRRNARHVGAAGHAGGNQRRGRHAGRCDHGHADRRAPQRKPGVSAGCCTVAGVVCQHNGSCSGAGAFRHFSWRLVRSASA